MSGLSISRAPVLASARVASSAAAQREKSLQAPPGFQDIHPVASRQVSLRDMVLTPARVPPFTIPPLCVASRPERCSAGGGSRRNTLPASAHSTRHNSVVTRRCCCCPFSALSLADMEPHTCTLSDPGTRAAMSLPHLAKITTPYGFVTLGESPCVRRRESLFFQENLTQTEAPQEEQQCVKLKSERSLRSCNVAACCCPAPQQENHPPTSCDCSKAYKCAQRPSSSQRKERLKYFLKKRFSA